jgi:hypothetical protein
VLVPGGGPDGKPRYDYGPPAALAPQQLPITPEAETQEARRKRNEAWASESGRKSAEEVAALSQARAAALAAGPNYDVLRNVVKGTATGPLAPGFATVGAIADAIGVPLQSISHGLSPSAKADQEVFDKAANKLVLDGLSHGLGANISNADRDFMTAAGPQFRNQPWANEIIIELGDGARQRTLERHAAWDDFSRANYSKGSPPELWAQFNRAVVRSRREGPPRPHRPFREGSASRAGQPDLLGSGRQEGRNGRRARPGRAALLVPAAGVSHGRRQARRRLPQPIRRVASHAAARARPRDRPVRGAARARNGRRVRDRADAGARRGGRSLSRPVRGHAAAIAARATGGRPRAMGERGRARAGGRHGAGPAL